MTGSHLPLIGALLAAVAAAPAAGQGVACRAISSDRTVTLQLARQGQEAARVFLGRLQPSVVLLHDQLERGLLAELEGRAEPSLLRDALQTLRQIDTDAGALDQALAGLERIHKQDRPVPVFERTLHKLLGERRLGPGRGLRRAGEEPTGIADILRMQRADLAAVRKAYAALEEAVRTAVPLAERRRLAAEGFAGRAPLLPVAQEALERWEAFRAFSIETCRTTAAAAVQIYPAGQQWLEEQEEGKP